LEVYDRILKRLDDWQEKEGSLPEPVGFYRDLLRAQVEIAGEVPRARPRVTQAEIAAQIRQGVPLIKWDALPVDWSLFCDLFQRCSEVIAEHTDSNPRQLPDPSSEAPALKEAAKAWFEGQPLEVWSSRLGIEENVLALNIHCALKPFLAIQSESLKDMVPQKQWRSGRCPICGGTPDFAYLEKEVGARWLLCSRCDSEWLYQRLQCPYCGVDDQEKLAYYPDESEVYRLYVCNSCKSYLKAIDLRRTDSEVLMPLERLLTADMDRQAEEYGYRPGWIDPQPSGDRGS